MTIGAMKDKATFYVQDGLAQEDGGQVVLWRQVGIYWVAVALQDRWLSNLEGGHRDRVTHTLEMRKPDLQLITVGMCVVWRDRVFVVRSVSDRKEKGYWLDLRLEEDPELSLNDLL